MGQPNSAHPDRSYAKGINIHKAGLHKLTGLTRLGEPVSAGCLLIGRGDRSNFIGNFTIVT